MQKFFTLFTAVLSGVMMAAAQPSLLLSNGRLALQPVASANLPVFYKQQNPVGGKRFMVVQFAGPLSAAQKETLAGSGIVLQAYIPPYSYTATLAKEATKTELQQAGITSLAYLSPSLKISRALQQPERHNWLPGNNGTVEVLIKVAGITAAEATTLLQAQHISITASGMENYNVLQARLPAAQLTAVAANPFVEWLDPVHPADKILNSKSTNMSAANVAHAPVSNGGYGLSGAGVVAGVGDDADPTNHIDLQDRIINRSAFVYNTHGTHVSGTVAGAGIFRYLSRGFAPAAKIVSQIFNGIWLNAATYVNDFGMMVTNNSYGSIVGDSTYEGVYDIYSQVLDQQAFQFPELLHVFAAGNDGEIVVPPFPFHYSTVLSSYQSAKNVVTVGRTDRVMYASSTSSSGPTRDGRLKPELMAIGEEIISCAGNGNYASEWGTSQAAPAITGGTVLLCEQYRKQFSGNPKSGLLKALLMNGGLDVGATGPDFRHGYGLMNLQRSLDMLKNNHFYSNSISTGGVQVQTITVPANMAQLKVLLYWHDPASSLYATKTLVNDLDIEVLDPQGNTVLPQKLDTSAGGVTNLPGTGTDHINNSEQVLINAPVAGTYTIRTKGYAVNVNATQPYFVAYDVLPLGLRLYVPYETDSYFPGDLMVIHWADNGTPANTRTLEYSLDDGATWRLIASNISASVFYYNWNIPDTLYSTTARIRISESNGFSNVSGRFVLMAEVYNSYADNSEQCEGYCKIIWPAVPYATDYEVLMKQGIDMQPIATTTATSYTVSGLNKDSVYWFCMRARHNGVAGSRNDGQAYQPNTGGCSGSISNGDLKVDAILNNTGRRFTTSELSSTTSLAIQVKNLDDAAVNEYDVKYSINGGVISLQHITTPLAAGGTAVVSFPGVNLSAEGVYTITAIVKNTQPDRVPKNDTLVKTIKQLTNAPLLLNSTFTENFESADSGKYEMATMGLNGLDRWDFTPFTGNGDSYGRLRTFVNTGIANGNRGITLDVRKFVDNSNLGSNQFTGTFNLSNYNAATDEVRLDFLYKQHGSFQQDAAVGKNQVLIKGTENAAAQTAYNLFASQPAAAGQWRRTESIELSDILTGAGQTFSPATQITFTQTSALGMGDNTHFGGYTFDDLRLYTVANDVQAIAIDSPAVNACALGSVPVKMRVKNSMSYAISSIPVKLQVDGATVATESIATIAPNTTITYTFAAAANLSAIGNHILKAWVDLPADNFRGNDTTTKTIINQPVISSFPYLQDFESGQGSFYTGGLNASWEYGLPNGYKIRSAASGTKAWKTSLAGVYNDEELSYLYSPCFNVSSLTNPTLSFAMAYDLEYCRPDACDGAWLEYSTNGETWNKLGSTGTGTNWYNNNTTQYWDSTKAWWHVATIPLPAGAQNLRLRFALSSDLFTGKEGVAIDDIHIYDKAADIFSSNANSNLITQNISGSGPVAFTDNGKAIASVMPNGNYLGSTGVKAWLYNGPVRNDGSRYFASRNLTVQPAVTSTGLPVTVRIYFTDAEADSLRMAAGCVACKAPKDYTFIGITKYTDPDKSKENGTMADNQNGTYSYFASSVVRKVPYAQGYYADVSINSFSELWLNDGTPGSVILPIQWQSFTADKRSNSQVLLQWMLQNESNALQYEVEVLLPGGSTYQRLATIPAVNQQPVSRYTFTDSMPNKQGIYQYRIKRTDRNGQISYSEVRLVLFSNKNLTVLVYPNPATTHVQVMLQGLANSPVQLALYDAAGKLLQQQTTVATGAAQKIQMGIAGLPAGMYQLKVQSGNDTDIIKVVKSN